MSEFDRAVISLWIQLEQVRLERLIREARAEKEAKS